MKVGFTFISPQWQVTAPVWVLAVDATRIAAQASYVLLQPADVHTDDRGLNKSLADVLTVSDTALILFQKGLADSVTVADAAAWSLVKALADATTATDALQRTVDYRRTFADTATATDGGRLLMNSYTDANYFAEDYVGSARTL